MCIRDRCSSGPESVTAGTPSVHKNQKHASETKCPVCLCQLEGVGKKWKHGGTVPRPSSRIRPKNNVKTEGKVHENTQRFQHLPPHVGKSLPTHHLSVCNTGGCLQYAMVGNPKVKLWSSLQLQQNYVLVKIVFYFSIFTPPSRHYSCALHSG